MMFVALLVALCAVTSHAALYEDEINSFTNTGSCGGYASIVESGSDYIISSNGLPDHEWACNNPNIPSEMTSEYTVPMDPEFLSEPLCLSGGSIGMARNGVAFYGPLTSSNVNAVQGDYAEAMDICGGHPSPFSQYHYHNLPLAEETCSNPLYNACNTSAQFLGLALDGFPIYSEGNYRGMGEIDTDALDECLGTTLPDGRYAYISAQWHYPYIMGCYKAQPAGNPRNIAACSGAPSGQLCNCGTSPSSAWYSYDEVTTYSRRTATRTEKKEEDLLDLLVRYMSTAQRARRSPRFNMARQTGTIESCLSYTDSYYDWETGTCPEGDYPVNTEYMTCSETGETETDDETEETVTETETEETETETETEETEGETETGSESEAESNIPGQILPGPQDGGMAPPPQQNSGPRCRNRRRGPQI